MTELGKIAINVPVNQPGEMLEFNPNKNDDDFRLFHYIEEKDSNNILPESNRDVFEVDEEINQEHSHAGEPSLKNKNESINHEEIVVEEKNALETKETLPRFAIGHKLSMKNLIILKN
jgi:hypothetical protein